MGMSFAQSLNASEPGRAFKRGIGRAFGFEYAHGQNMGWLGSKMPGGRFGAGIGGFAFRALGPAMVGMGMYQGYKEGGVLGAAKSLSFDLSAWGAFEAGATLLLSPGMFAASTIATGIYGGYKFGEAAQKHRKRLRNLEMGSDLVDRFGTLTTMRQRSLAAIQRTHVNGRTALGNEATLLSNMYLR